MGRRTSFRRALGDRELIHTLQDVNMTEDSIASASALELDMIALFYYLHLCRTLDTIL